MKLFALLLLAQAITYYTRPDPKVPNGYITEVYEMQDRNYTSEIFDTMERGWEAAQTGVDAPFLQRGRYYSPDGGSPIRTVIPPSERRTLTWEQEMQRREEEAQALERQVRVQGALLNQRIAVNDERYKLNTMQQAEALINELPSLVPGKDDYLLRRSELFGKYPLGAQTAAVLRMTEALDGTHKHIVDNNDGMARERALREEANRQRDIDQGRAIAAKYGSRALAQYEDMLKQNPQESPLGAIAKMADAQEEEDTVAELKRRGINPNQFYSPEISIGGGRTGGSRFDIKGAKQALKDIPDEGEAIKASTLRAKLRSANEGVKFEDWPVDDQIEWNILTNQLRRYGKATGQDVEKTEQKIQQTGGTKPEGSSSILW